MFSANRPIFKKNKLIGANERGTYSNQSPIVLLSIKRKIVPTGAFVHPSVYILDHNDPYIIEFINKQPYREQLRAQQIFTIPDKSQLFWDLEHETVIPNNEQSVDDRSNQGTLFKKKILFKRLKSSMPDVIRLLQPGQRPPPSPNTSYAIKTLFINLELSGVHPYSMSALIQGYLWPPGSESTHLGNVWSTLLPCAWFWLFGRFVIQTSFIIGIIILLGLGFKPARVFTMFFMFSSQNYILPIFFFEIPWIIYSYWLYKYRLSLLQVRSGIDILLVYDHLIWHGGKHVNEHSIRSACLSYLRQRPNVHEKMTNKIWKDFPWPAELARGFDAKSLVKEFLDEFGFRH